MKEYTVAYIKDTEDIGYDTFKPGTTIKEIVDGLIYQMNRYGVDFDEIAIFNVNDEEETFYYKVVNMRGHYILV